MQAVLRKVVYRLYPSRYQEAGLREMLVLHQRLYNAALEQRKAAWRLQPKSLSVFDRCRDLTLLRAEDARYAWLNARSAQVTLKRLHLAFVAFYRRCRQGKEPGFPRFKALDRYSGWGYATHGDGFRFTLGDGGRNGRLRLVSAQRALARKKRRSKNRIKARELVPALQRKAADKRRDFVQQKKPLSQRLHACACGTTLNRDQNAARVLLWALARG